MESMIANDVFLGNRRKLLLYRRFSRFQPFVMDLLYKSLAFNNNVTTTDLSIRQGGILDKNEVKGAWKETKGKIREVWGDVTGNSTEKMHGKVEQVAGTVQRKYGEAKSEFKRKV
jgi:uncharacterized protein YjbJ (UPF0337 family)